MVDRHDTQKWLRAAKEVHAFVKGVEAWAKKETNATLIGVFDMAEFRAGRVVLALDTLDAVLARQELERREG